MTSIPSLESNPSPSAEGWNPWPVGLVVVLGLFATGVFSFGVLAVRHSQDLVSADYYDREIRYQEHIDRVARAGAVSSGALASVDATTRTLSLVLSRGAVGQVEFYRPANAQWDRILPLALDREGRQRIDLSGLQAGLWRIRVLWSVGGLDYLREVRFVSLGGE